jgi:pimeloyl-ACP methyl ester carboxylesterase
MPSLTDAFETLQHSHPLRHLRFSEVDWAYRRVGDGPEGLLALPGAAGGGEVYFPLADALGSRYTMVMIHYPSVPGLDELVAGLAAILDAEGLERTALLGGSFGGLIAQAFLLHHPERTTRAVLSATGPPRAARAAFNETWLRRTRFLPAALFRGLLRLVVRKLLATVDEEREFWKRFYLGAIDSLDRAQIESQYRVSIDFDRHGGDLVPRLANWPGEILLIAGSSDRLASAEAREELALAYPQAESRILEGAGHAVSLEQPEAWRGIVADFLLRS